METGYLPSAFSLRVPGIIEMGTQEEMRWVNAKRNIALVQHKQAVSNSTIGLLPGETMGVNELFHLTGNNSKNPIALRIACG